MDIAQFNQKLASFIRDARLLEKTDPKKARILWLKIAQYALEFSKKAGIDRDFKISLWRQIDAIIKKVKAEEIAAGRELGETSEGEEPYNESISHSEFETGAENIDISSLPSVPKEGDEEVTDKHPSISKGNIKPESNIQQNKTKNISFFEQIQNMENELKQMPDIFKEVPAVPYDPKKTIIKPTKEDPKQDNSDVVNIQQVGKDIFGNQPLDLGNDNIDPYKGTKDFNEIKDPFGPAGIDQSINELNISNSEKTGTKGDFIFCSKCGVKSPVGSKNCPHCGNSL